MQYCLSTMEETTTTTTRDEEEDEDRSNSNSNSDSHDNFHLSNPLLFRVPSWKASNTYNSFKKKRWRTKYSRLHPAFRPDPSSFSSSGWRYRRLGPKRLVHLPCSDTFRMDRNNRTNHVMYVVNKRNRRTPIGGGPQYEWIEYANGEERITFL